MPRRVPADLRVATHEVSEREAETTPSRTRRLTK